MDGPPVTLPGGLSVYRATLEEEQLVSVFVYQRGNEEAVNKAAQVSSVKAGPVSGEASSVGARSHRASVYGRKLGCSSQESVEQRQFEFIVKTANSTAQVATWNSRCWFAM